MAYFERCWGTPSMEWPSGVHMGLRSSRADDLILGERRLAAIGEFCGFVIARAADPPPGRADGPRPV
jgi:hypothetical protein